METAPAIQIGIRSPRVRSAWRARIAPRGATVVPMADPAATEDRILEAEEARLARAAGGGDGDAFATLYERYARRAYNLALRVGGSEDDAADAVQEAFVNVLRRLPELDERDLVFRSYLFTATRNATLDLLRRQQRARPSDSIPEAAVPLGTGAGGMGLDPGDPDEDPDRRVLLASQREEIREANARLPERQREALALRELEELSYDEIAAVMEMNRNSVAQLISRARINLRDELRGGALASVAGSSADCERALPLIAMRDDGQLDPDCGDADWLDRHLAGCGTCPVAAEAMQEAGASYRLWAPVAVAPWLFRETMARAAAAVGADWSEVREPRGPNDAGLPGLPAAYRAASGSAAAARSRRTRRVLAVASGLLLIGAATTLFAAELDDATRAEPVKERRAAITVPVKAPASERMRKAEPTSRDRRAEPVDAAPAPASEPAPETVASPLPPQDSSAGKEPPPAQQPTTRSGGNVAPTEPLEKEPSESEPPAPPPPPAPPAEPPPAEPPPPSEPPPAEPPPRLPEPPNPSAPPGSAPPQPEG